MLEEKLGDHQTIHPERYKNVFTEFKGNPLKVVDLKPQMQTSCWRYIESQRITKVSRMYCVENMNMCIISHNDLFSHPWSHAAKNCSMPTQSKHKHIWWPAAYMNTQLYNITSESCFPLAWYRLHSLTLFLSDSIVCCIITFPDLSHDLLPPPPSFFCFPSSSLTSSPVCPSCTGSLVGQ